MGNSEQQLVSNKDLIQDATDISSGSLTYTQTNRFQVFISCSKQLVAAALTFDLIKHSTNTIR